MLVAQILSMTTTQVTSMTTNDLRALRLRVRDMTHDEWCALSTPDQKAVYEAARVARDEAVSRRSGTSA